MGLARAFASLLLVGRALASSACRPQPRPNIVLVVVDTLRADHLDHFGYRRRTAASLDLFRSQSTRFTNCTTPAPWTSPSVASLFTGLSTLRHRLNEHGAKLGDEADTLAEILSRHGWQTVGISFNAEVTNVSGFGQGFDRFDDHLGKVRTYPDASEMVSRVARFLESDVSQPFFLYLQPMNVHGPYRVPEAERDVLLGRPPIRAFLYQIAPMSAIMRRGQIDRRDEVTPHYLNSLVEQYDTAVRYTLDQVSEIVKLQIPPDIL